MHKSTVMSFIILRKSSGCAASLSGCSMIKGFAPNLARKWAMDAPVKIFSKSSNNSQWQKSLWIRQWEDWTKQVQYNHTLWPSIELNQFWQRTQQILSLEFACSSAAWFFYVVSCFFSCFSPAGPSICWTSFTMNIPQWTILNKVWTIIFNVYIYMMIMYHLGPISACWNVPPAQNSRTCGLQYRHQLRQHWSLPLKSVRRMGCWILSAGESKWLSYIAQGSLQIFTMSYSEIFKAIQTSNIAMLRI